MVNTLNGYTSREFKSHLHLPCSVSSHPLTICYASCQTYVEVKDTYSEGGTHKETLRPQSKARVMNKRRGDKVTIRQIADS